MKNADLVIFKIKIDKFRPLILKYRWYKVSQKPDKS